MCLTLWVETRMVVWQSKARSRQSEVKKVTFLLKKAFEDLCVCNWYVAGSSEAQCASVWMIRALIAVEPRCVRAMMNGEGRKQKGGRQRGTPRCLRWCGHATRKALQQPPPTNSGTVNHCTIGHSPPSSVGLQEASRSFRRANRYLTVHHGGVQSFKVDVIDARRHVHNTALFPW